MPRLTSSIDATLEQIAKSVQVAVIGCIDLTDRVRARTTLELLSALAVAGLPPATPLTDAFHTQAGTRGLTVGAPDPTQDARYQTVSGIVTLRDSQRTY